MNYIFWKVTFPFAKCSLIFHCPFFHLDYSASMGMWRTQNHVRDASQKLVSTNDSFPMEFNQDLLDECPTCRLQRWAFFRGIFSHPIVDNQIDRACFGWVALRSFGHFWSKYGLHWLSSVKGRRNPISLGHFYDMREEWSGKDMSRDHQGPLHGSGEGGVIDNGDPETWRAAESHKVLLGQVCQLGRSDWHIWNSNLWFFRWRTLSTLDHLHINSKFISEIETLFMRDLQKFIHETSDKHINFNNYEHKRHYLVLYFCYSLGSDEAQQG